MVVNLGRDFDLSVCVSCDKFLVRRSVEGFIRSAFPKGSRTQSGNGLCPSNIEKTPPFQFSLRQGKSDVNEYDIY